MKAILFIMAVGLGLLALASRKHLNRNLDPDDDDNTQVEQTMKKSPAASQSLNYALNRISQGSKGNPLHPPPVQNQPIAGPEGVTNEVGQYLKQMQDNPDQAFTYLERGLAITTTPELAAQHLSLLQAALGVAGNEGTIKDIALREMTSNIVDSPTDQPITDPAAIASLETRRMIVSTAYKLYLNVSRDPEATFADTQRVLSYQRDQSTKELILYDCLSRFPELRERLMTN